MQRQAKLRLFDFFAPAILGIFFLIKIVYIVLIGWWLDPFFQRKEKRVLLEDIRANLYFIITSQTNVSKQIKKSGQALMVRIPWENILVTVTRWHGETNLGVAPRHAPNDSYELGPLIAALERRHFSEHDVVNDLVSAANLLQPRLQALSNAFSEQQYRQTKDTLWK